MVYCLAQTIIHHVFGNSSITVIKGFRFRGRKIGIWGALLYEIVYRVRSSTDDKEL